MEKPTPKWPELFVRWNNGRPVLSRKPEPLPAEPARKAEQVAANQEWEDEGGATKPSLTTQGPKLPL
jgi:hypothetical protein